MYAFSKLWVDNHSCSQLWEIPACTQCCGPFETQLSVCRPHLVCLLHQPDLPQPLRLSRIPQLRPCCRQRLLHSQGRLAPLRVQGHQLLSRSCQRVGFKRHLLAARLQLGNDLW
jgi:hypothetical protein